MKVDVNITENNIRDMLMFIEKETSRLKFHKRLGCFLLYKRIRDNKDYVLGNDCCVCLELTLSCTSCNHTLCVECFQHLSERICPMCRDDDIHLVMNTNT